MVYTVVDIHLTYALVMSEKNCIPTCFVRIQFFGGIIYNPVIVLFFRKPQRTTANKPKITINMNYIFLFLYLNDSMNFANVSISVTFEV